jgi:hypothetical protein
MPLSPPKFSRKRPKYVCSATGGAVAKLKRTSLSSNQTTYTTSRDNSTTTPKFDRPVKIGNKVIDSPDRRPPRTLLVRIHSALFCCVNFNFLCSWISRLALSGKRTKGHPVYKNTTAEERKTLDALNIEPKSIERLYEVFVQIDRDGSGEISISEFFRHFSHKRRFPQKSKFSKRVFQIMDADNSGELSFIEFVISLWNFCTFTKASLLRFAFELCKWTARCSLCCFCYCFPFTKFFEHFNLFF